MDPRLLIGPLYRTCGGTTRISASVAAAIELAKRRLCSSILAVHLYERDGSQGSMIARIAVAMRRDSALVFADRKF